MTPNVPRTCSAWCAISFRECSTPAAGGWPRWDPCRSNPRLPRNPQPPTSPEPVWAQPQPRPRAITHSRGGPRGKASGRDGAGFGQQLLQFAALVHLDGDVAAADELAVDIELRESRPIGIGLQRLAHFRILENIHVRKLRLASAQSTDGLRRESALRKIGGALHVQDHRRGRELALDPFDSIHSTVSKLIPSTTIAAFGAPRGPLSAHTTREDLRQALGLVELLGLLPYSSSPPQCKIRAAAPPTAIGGCRIRPNNLKGIAHEPVNDREVASHFRL